MYYITNLTSLLESIAHIIDQHQPVVDKYYGEGRMRKVVGRLVGESDRVVRNLVEGWEEERRVGRLVRCRCFFANGRSQRPSSRTSLYCPIQVCCHRCSRRWPSLVVPSSRERRSRCRRWRTRRQTSLQHFSRMRLVCASLSPRDRRPRRFLKRTLAQIRATSTACLVSSSRSVGDGRCSAALCAAGCWWV